MAPASSRQSRRGRKLKATEKAVLPPDLAISSSNTNNNVLIPHSDTPTGITPAPIATVAAVPMPAAAAETVNSEILRLRKELEDLNTQQEVERLRAELVQARLRSSDHSPLQTPPTSSSAHSQPAGQITGQLGPQNPAAGASYPQWPHQPWAQQYPQQFQQQGYSHPPFIPNPLQAQIQQPDPDARPPVSFLHSQGKPLSTYPLIMQYPGLQEKYVKQIYEGSFKPEDFGKLTTDVSHWRELQGGSIEASNKSIGAAFTYTRNLHPRCPPLHTYRRGSEY